MRLKRYVRQKFEYEHEGALRIVWGLDSQEKKRAEKLVNWMPRHEHLFPLIDQRRKKKDAHAILKASGIKRPAMYDRGYHNNNCVGCVKGGAGYWNHIRLDFPEVFASRAKLERDIGISMSTRYYLDELCPERGRHAPPIVEDCGIWCEAVKL